MDTVTLSSRNLADKKYSANNPSRFVKQPENQYNLQPKKSAPLVQKTAPAVGSGNGRLLNLYA